MLANDVDPEDDPLTVDSIVTEPNHGTVSILPDGTVTYTPNTDFFGEDSFIYRVCDTENQCAEATITIDVELVPIPQEDVGPTESFNQGPFASKFVSADISFTPCPLLELNDDSLAFFITLLIAFQ